jgi:hypothetical protein
MPVTTSHFFPAVLIPALLTPTVFASLILCLSVNVLADPVYAEDFDTDLPPPRDGVDTSLVTGMWLLKFKDVGIYKRYDEDGNSTKTEVVTTGWVYDLIAPTILRDDNNEIIEEDHTKPQSLGLACLPFDKEDGSHSQVGDWSTEYEAVNFYYNSITKEITDTGKLTVNIKDDGTLTATGKFKQHPSGFKSRFNADNLISHRLEISGVKISDTASFRDNPDFESTLYSCSGAMLTETSEEGITPTINTELLGIYTSDNSAFITEPYFEGYNFYVSTRAQVAGSDDETTHSLTFN